MSEDEQILAVKVLLFDYLRSPSLRHIRDPHSVAKLAREIVRKIDHGNSIWGKWDGQREFLLKSAVGCWVPLDAMRDFLNRMPGPRLSMTDVTQRLKVCEEEDPYRLPNDELRPGCLALYEKENAEGTELPAIIGVLGEYVDREEDRIRIEQSKRRQQLREQSQISREQRLLSGADCNWTQLRKSLNWYCRTNGRTYRLSPTNDKMWSLHRVSAVSDEEKGGLIGKYRLRGDASKVVAETAYKPEPTW
ncbi:MAG TPA: hypothetical protein VMU81_25235 [Acetobacteraceae bacterium]|nr:hypothetical protein [Acetobacteraceae bacterium]